MNVHINTGASDNQQEGELSPNLLKKFINYARVRCGPRLSQEAAEKLKNKYVLMRSGTKEVEEDRHPHHCPSTGSHHPHLRILGQDGAPTLCRRSSRRRSSEVVSSVHLGCGHVWQSFHGGRFHHQRGSRTVQLCGAAAEEAFRHRLPGLGTFHPPRFLQAKVPGKGGSKGTPFHDSSSWAPASNPKENALQNQVTSCNIKYMIFFTLTVNLSRGARRTHPEGNSLQKDL